MAGTFNTFETGATNGSALTGANSGDGDAGTAFGSNWYMSAGTTPTYSTEHPARGDLGGKLSIVASGGGSLGFNTGTSPGFWTRGYFRHASTPTANSILLAIRDGAVSASGFQVRLMSAGTLQILDRAAFAGVATTPVTPGVLYRLETYFTIAGVWQYWLYEGHDETAVATASGTVATTAAAKFDFCRWGLEGSNQTNTLWLDELAWSDEAKIGPAPDTAPPSNVYVRKGGAWIQHAPYVWTSGAWVPTSLEAP